ncbi:MAG: TniQ family protein [Yokenella regensburgei]|jgi:hypothetical protein|nr:TniQ family protein [Yokenella regensburgei]
MLTRLRYLPDETLHSFIFRVCLVNGDENFADVTDHHVQWKEKLQLNVKTTKYFTEYSDNDFLFLLRNAWQAKRNIAIFDNPIEYMSEINSLLTRQRPRRGHGHNPQLKYCIDCIRESISKNGFGYFKSSWHHRFSEYCFIHNIPLTHYKKHSTVKPHEVLKTVISGEHPLGCYNILRKYKPRKERQPLLTTDIDTFVERTLPYDHGEFIFISKCLRTEIENFIRIYPNDLPKMALISDVFNKTIIRRPYNERYLFQDYILSKILRCFFEENFQPFMTFWKKNASKTVLYCGVVKPTDVTEHIYIYQDTDKCGVCKHLSCPMKTQLTNYTSTY